MYELVRPRRAAPHAAVAQMRKNMRDGQKTPEKEALRRASRSPAILANKPLSNVLVQQIGTCCGLE